MPENFWYRLHALTEIPQPLYSDNKTLSNLKIFFESWWWWECGFYDYISYKNTLEKFTWKQMASILEYVSDLIYHTPSIDRLNELFSNKKIDIDIRRLIFYNLYDLYRIELCKIFYEHLWVKYVNNINI